MDKMAQILKPVHQGGEMSHTPTPWTLLDHPILDESVWEVYAPESASRHWIAHILADAGEGNDGKANAAYIVAAVNAHESLTRQNEALRAALESLRRAAACLEDSLSIIGEIRQARAALEAK